MSTTNVILIMGGLAIGAFLYTQSQKGPAGAAVQQAAYTPQNANLTTGMGGTAAPTNQGGTNEYDMISNLANSLGGMFESMDW